MSQYKYTPLPSQRHIRILVIEPSEDIDSPFSCFFAPTTIDEPLEYAALSYSWGMSDDGDASLCRTINLEGCIMPITRNLFEGLRRIRSQTVCISLWIIALCIDQANDKEKAFQVAMMAKIYQAASETCVWLGESEWQQDEEVYLFFRRMLSVTIPQFASETYEDRLRFEALFHNGPGTSCKMRSESCPCGALPLLIRTTWPIGRNSRYDSASSNTGESKRFLAILARDEPDAICLFRARLLVLERFLSRRYWNRRWIIQELHFSKRKHILWGHCYLPAEDFIDSIMNLCRIGDMLDHMAEHLGFDPTMFARVHESGTLRSQNDTFRTLFHNLMIRTHVVSSDPWPSFMTNMASFQSSDCSDPRDRIYALLSLSPQLGIEPNYSRSCADVYASFAGQLIKNNEVAFIFRNPPRRPNAGVMADLLSWVPDFRVFVDFGSSAGEILPNVDLKNERTITLRVWVIGRIVGSSSSCFQLEFDPSMGTQTECDTQASTEEAGNTSWYQVRDRSWEHQPSNIDLSLLARNDLVVSVHERCPSRWHCSPHDSCPTFLRDYSCGSCPPSLVSCSSYRSCPILFLRASVDSPGSRALSPMKIVQRASAQELDPKGHGSFHVPTPTSSFIVDII